MIVSRAAMLAMILALAACGGGGTPIAPIGQPPSHTTGTVSIALSIPAPPTTPARTRRDRISSSARGVSTSVYFHSDAHHTNAVGAAAFDVSAASALCTAGSSGRTCTLAIPAPTSPQGDSDDVVLTTYDAAPSSGAIPVSANALDTGSFTVVVAAGAQLSQSVTFGGMPASIAVSIDNPHHLLDSGLYGSMPYYVEVVVKDAAGVTIIGSDPYVTPITLQASSSAVTFLVNGTAATTLTRPTDTVVLTDTNATAATYTVSGSAGSLRSPAVSYTLEPRGTATQFAFHTSPTWLAPGNDGRLYGTTSSGVLLQFDLATQGTTSIPVTALSLSDVARAPNNGEYVMYATHAHGQGVGSYNGTTTTNTALSATFGNCAVSSGNDGNGYVACAHTIWNANNTSLSSAFSTPAFTGMTSGSDGRLWLADNTGSIYALAPSDVGTSNAPSVYSSGLNAGSLPYRITSGNDGAVWFTDQGTTPAIGRVTTAGTISEYAIPDGALPYGIASGADGALWFSAQGGTSGNYIGRFDPTALTFTTYVTTLTAPRGIALGSDDAIWFVDNSTGMIGRVTP